MPKLSLKVNGETREVEVEGDKPLLWVLREDFGLTGTKFGCGAALCGACTVHLDGQPVRSCSLPAASIGNKAVVTIEAIDHPIQEVWAQLSVAQCGYCQSGQVMSAVALLAQNPKPKAEDIDTALAGNICRCGTYPRIREAILKAAEG